MKRFTNLFEFAEALKQVYGDDYPSDGGGILIPESLSDEQAMEYIAQFQAEHRKREDIKRKQI